MLSVVWLAPLWVVSRPFWPLSGLKSDHALNWLAAEHGWRLKTGTASSVYGSWFVRVLLGVCEIRRQGSTNKRWKFYPSHGRCKSAVDHPKRVLLWLVLVRLVMRRRSQLKTRYAWHALTGSLLTATLSCFVMAATLPFTKPATVCLRSPRAHSTATDAKLSRIS